MSSDSADELSL